MSEKNGSIATQKKQPFEEKESLLPKAPSAEKKKRVFSAIQPTGTLHLGNYLGAIRNWVHIAHESIQTGDLAVFSVADAHAITMPHDPKELKSNILHLARDLIACGIDPEKLILFVQSDVREHMELQWYFSSVTPLGDLDRMTQFKDKSEAQEFVSTALYTYPILMSADILLYKADLVPVGDDQLQHLELTRETARRFNHRFGKVFPEPQPKLTKAPRIRGLDGDSKMSKSKRNTIDLFEDPNTFWKKLKGAFTDPARVSRSDPGHPQICNIYTMHKEISPENIQEMVAFRCENATWGCFDCKEKLFSYFEAELVPLRKRRADLSLVDVQKHLHHGAQKARDIASKTIKQVREAIGLGSE